MVSPQRNVNFDAKKWVSELEGLTFAATRPQCFLFSKKLQVESRQLLDVRRSCFQQLAWVFPTPLERSDISKYFAIHFHGAFCGGDIVWDRILSQLPPVVYSTGVYPNSISASYFLFHAPNTTAVVTLPQ